MDCASLSVGDLSSLRTGSDSVGSGKTFGDLFQYFTNNVATKPMFITEFGIDAYDNSKQTENQVVHSEYVTSLWNEIVANTGACSGGCVFAYCDEW